jgi:molybdopterin/thiamine biosynthesis adenylyltransferase
MSNPKLDKYRVQTQLDDVGPQGQEKLKQSRVVVIGCGGLGSAAVPYLVGAGIGEVILMDGDVVSETNLHRQVTYGGQVGQYKAKILAAFCENLNPEIKIHFHTVYFEAKHKDEIHRGDFVLDCTDNIQTKLLLEEVCKQKEATLLAASVEQFEGFLAVITPQFKGNALDQIYPIEASLKACSEVGILGPVVGIMGLQQALTCMKMVLGIAVQTNGFTWYDFKANDQRFVAFLEQASNQVRNSPFVREVNLKDIDTSKQLVSILEDYEHVDLGLDFMHLPLDRLDISKLKTDVEYVFYCTNGKRSWALVDRIQRMRPELRVMSLRGGANGQTK